MPTVQTLMTTPPVTALGPEPLVEAVRRMHEHRIGSLVVVDAEGRPVGIVTERDVLRLAATGGDGVGTTVAEAMTSPLDTLGADTEASVALSTLRERGYRHMPVTRGDELVGVVSLRDLARVATTSADPAGRPEGVGCADPAHRWPDVPRGLKGVVVADTAVADVRGSEGFYHYRQHSAVELAVSRPFEDVWRLLLDGALPVDRAEREAFRAEVAPLRAVPAAVAEALPAIARTSAPLEGLRTALSLAASDRGLRPLLDLDPSARRRDALFVSALAPTLVAALHRLSRGLEPVAPRDDLSHAGHHLWLLTGEEPEPAHAEALERYLISTIDHGFNASTFTARVIASTGADVGACVVGALGALSGPLHGGAPSRALDLLDEIGEPGRAREVVTRKVRAGERIMGFGHAVYRTDDPRSVLLRDVARGLGGPLVELAVAVEETVVDVLAELKPGRELHANVELYAGVVMAACGIPPEMFTPTFAASRVVGWCANVLEQAADPKIIRPSARYVGPPPPAPVPPLRADAAA